MIQLIRIDDRLLHGQVAYSWKAGLGYQAIVIADDNVADDAMRKSIIKMATPAGVKLAIRNIEDASNLLNNEKLKNVKVFVIVANPKSAYELYSKIDEKPDLNLGGMMNKENTREFAKAVYLSDEDFEYLKKIQGKNINIDVRQTPSENSQNFEELKNKF